MNLFTFSSMFFLKQEKFSEKRYSVPLYVVGQCLREATINKVTCTKSFGILCNCGSFANMYNIVKISTEVIDLRHHLMDRLL